MPHHNPHYEFRLEHLAPLMSLMQCDLTVTCPLAFSFQGETQAAPSEDAVVQETVEVCEDAVVQETIEVCAYLNDQQKSLPAEYYTVNINHWAVCLNP